jgi:hypothetical protein
MNYKVVSNRTGKSVRGHEVHVEEVTSILDSGNTGGQVA